MWKFIFRMTGQHIRRMPWVSLAIIFIFTFLFLATYGWIQLYGVYRTEKQFLEWKFAYQIPINTSVTLENPRVQDFVKSLWELGIYRVESITREQTLDLEIRDNPEILQVFDGKIPYPDVLKIPLKGDTDALWWKMKEFEDVIDFSDDRIEFRKRLLSYEKSLEEIQKISLLFIGGVVLVIVLLCIVIGGTLSFHLSRFAKERQIGHLVGAKLSAIWWPYILAMVCYMSISYLLAQWVLYVLYHFF